MKLYDVTGDGTRGDQKTIYVSTRTLADMSRASMKKQGYRVRVTKFDVEPTREGIAKALNEAANKSARQEPSRRA